MARCAQASAGAAAGSSATSSGTSTMVDSVTVARSAAGVISIDAPARTDTCPYAVTRLRRDSTWAASTRSLRCADTRITLRSPESPGDRAQPARPRQPSTSVVRSRRHCLLVGGQPPHRVQSGPDRFEVVPGHRVGVLLLAGGASLDTGHDEGKAEPQPKVVVRALDLVGDGAQYRTGNAGEHHPVRRFQCDAFGEALAPELDVAVEHGVVVPCDDLAERHAGHERQGIVRFEHEAVPDGGAVELRFVGNVDGQLVGYVDHGVLLDESMTAFSSAPRPSMVVRTTSPARRNSPRPAPTTEGVQVGMTSPGSSVTTSLAAEMSSATVQIMSDVDSSCWSSPFTQRRTRRSCGSGTRNAGVIPGPMGRDPSVDLAANQS